MAITINFGEWQGIDMRNSQALADAMLADFPDGGYIDGATLDDDFASLESQDTEEEGDVYDAYVALFGAFDVVGDSLVGTVNTFVIYSDADAAAYPDPDAFRVQVTGLEAALEDVLDALGPDGGGLATLAAGQTQTIYGSLAWGDILVGGTLTDNIWGFGGNDTLNGGGGTDILAGGAGKDRLAGGGGADVFTFGDAALLASNADVIKDFRHLVDDIALDNSKFTKLANGALAAKFFRSLASVTPNTGYDANDYLLYETSTGKLYYDPDASGTAKKPILVATLANFADLTFTAADIVVV